MKKVYAPVLLAIAAGVVYAQSDFNVLNINNFGVFSEMNEKLDLLAPVVGSEKLAKSDVIVSLAPKKYFAAAGIAVTDLHDSLQVSTFKDKNNRTVVQLSSNKPVTQDGVQVVVQVDSPQGRIYRQFGVSFAGQNGIVSSAQSPGTQVSSANFTQSTGAYTQGSSYSLDSVTPVVVMNPIIDTKQPVTYHKSTGSAEVAGINFLEADAVSVNGYTSSLSSEGTAETMSSDYVSSGYISSDYVSSGYDSSEYTSFSDTYTDNTEYTSELAQVDTYELGDTSTQEFVSDIDTTANTPYEESWTESTVYSSNDGYDSIDYNVNDTSYLVSSADATLNTVTDVSMYNEVSQGILSEDNVNVDPATFATINETISSANVNTASAFVVMKPIIDVKQPISYTKSTGEAHLADRTFLDVNGNTALLNSGFADTSVETFYPEQVISGFVSGDNTCDGHVIVKGDSLWELAEGCLYGPQSVYQKMVAIYNRNKTAFNGNLNSLRKGKVLAMPTEAEVNSVSKATAWKTYKAQTEARQKVTAVDNDEKAESFRVVVSKEQ